MNTSEKCIQGYQKGRATLNFQLWYTKFPISSVAESLVELEGSKLLDVFLNTLIKSLYFLTRTNMKMHLTLTELW